jgi:N-acetylmuramoyl-L-alanine amidase
MIVTHVWGAVRRAVNALSLGCSDRRHYADVTRLRRACGGQTTQRRGAFAVFLLLVTALLVPASSSVAAGSLRLMSADAEANGPVSTLSLALNAPAEYHVFSLANPDRIVIDLPELQLAQIDLPRQVGLIGHIRAGRPTAGATRLVVDCTEPATVEATQLTSDPSGRGHVLSVSLRSTGEGAGATAAVVPVAAPGRYAVTGWTAPPPRKRPDEPARSPASIAPTARPVIPSKRVVVIDPGHGGRDPGAMTDAGVMEKTITLAVARELRHQLNALGGYRAVLTRDRDVYIGLRERIAIARKAGADLMVSVHADKLANTGIRGLSVYTLSERASDAEAAALAERENKVDLISHLDLRGATPEVTTILIDLVQRDTLNNANRFASVIVTQMRRETRLLQPPHRFAGFAVLKAPDVPSVLVELGFLSNAEDAKALTSTKGRKPIVRALARSVDSYFTRFQLANNR